MQDFHFKLPDIGEGTTEAEITAWHVNVGDAVREDQPLLDVMTEKATVEISSPVSGVVASIHAAAGDKAAVGSVLIGFKLAGQHASGLPVVEASAAGSLEAAPAPSEGPVLGPNNRLDSAVGEREPRPSPSGGSEPPNVAVAHELVSHRPLAAPAVRRRARELGISLKLVSGSGPRGRIMHQDIDAHLARETPAAGRTPTRVDSSVEEVRVIGLRRKIAERMSQSKRNIPHFGYVEEVDMTELESLRAHLNSQAGGQQPKLTPLPFIMRAVVLALRNHPNINATYDGEAEVLRRHLPIHMGVATQTPNGLVVPVVRDVQARNLWDCARELARVSAAARSGKATREELSGSTITLTSLGPLGGIAATPVINYPEVAIIGPNRITERPVVRDGQIVVRKMMNVSSSFDHRIVDGYEAAEFIHEVRTLLEVPGSLFIDRP
jgi:2-oxoisovalerate dehydrogenase E2 component (dihydrolipoyl transacylase)